MRDWLTSNEKLKKDGILAWSIPAFRSKTGFVTCPSAGVCAKGCYARQGNFTRFKAVGETLEARLALSQTPAFVTVINRELHRRRPKLVRIHAAGDFYSWEYLNAWLEIIKFNPAITFYAYTKQVAMFKTANFEFPDNLVVIFSYGGKQDNLINPAVDRHARVFDSVQDLKIMGYVNASDSDLLALTTNHWVGLVYHGAKSRNAFNQGKVA